MKRGSKDKTHQHTAPIIAQDKLISWEEQPPNFIFQCSIRKDTKNKVDSKKELSIFVKSSLSKDSSKKKETKTIGTTSLNLSDYMEHGTIRHESLPLKCKEKGVTPMLSIKIESKWLKINNKILVKREGSELGNKENIEVGGEKYNLETTDEITANTAASSDNEEEKVVFERDEENKKEIESQTSSKTEIKELDFLRTEVLSLKKEKEELEKRLASVPQINDTSQAEIEDLKTDNKRLTKKIEKLRQELDEQKSHQTSEEIKSLEQKGEQIEETKESSALFTQMKDELKKKEKENEEISSSKKELEKNQKKLKKELNSLKQENDDKDKLITQLKLDINQLEEQRGLATTLSELQQKAVSLESELKAVNKELVEEKQLSISKQKENLSKEKELQEKFVSLTLELENKSKALVEYQKRMENLKENEEKAQPAGNEEEEEKLTKIKIQRQEKEIETLKKKISLLQRENQELKLIQSSIFGELGYEEGTNRPTGVAPLVESLNSWNVFDPFNSELLSTILEAIRKSFTRSSFDNEILTYWLSFILHLYQLLKPSVPSSAELDETPLQREVLTDDEEAKRGMKPVTKFFYELCSIAADVYSLLLINLYSQLDGIIPEQMINPKSRFRIDFGQIVLETLHILRKRSIPEKVINLFIDQVFYFTDVQCFNYILSQETLTCGKGFEIKMSLSQVEKGFKKDKHLHSVMNDRMNHTKEAVNLLVMDKYIVGDEKMLQEIFSHLNPNQIKYLLEHFTPDDFAPDPVPDEVIDKLDGMLEKKNFPLQLDPTFIKRVNLLKE